MANRMPTFFPTRINASVRNMKYAADVIHTGPIRVTFTAPVAAATTGLLATTSLTAGAATTIVSGFVTQTVPGEYGRTLTVNTSATTARTLGIRGRDYLGQPMRENITLSSQSATLSKAFKQIDELVIGTGTDTGPLEVGYTARLGLPYKALSSTVIEFNDTRGLATSGGTLTMPQADNTTPTATTGETRGVHAFATIDGSNYSLEYRPDRENLHGLAHFYN